jgi:hypothetical protein
MHETYFRAVDQEASPAQHAPKATAREWRLDLRELDAAKVVELKGWVARVLGAWLADLGAEAVLVRPDRVVMASGPIAAAPRWLETLGRACGWREPSGA